MSYYPYSQESSNYLSARTNELTVIGEGTVMAPPDEAIINIGILSESKNLQQAQQENSMISQRVINSLRQLGIHEKDLQTSEYRIENVYDYVQGKQIFRGYEVRHILEVKVADIRLVGIVVDTAVANGANMIYHIRFTISTREEKYNQALSIAVVNARQKAFVIGKAIGVQIQSIPFEISELRDGSPIIPFQTYSLEKVAAATTPIQTGQLEIKATISAKFTY
ncbi:SIMPL domain-containing protein [Bacillus kwashiorkori]|uniref:SIMPL domain-containing protein n=1 Tax=Bacillus kwashiorkori TaxID=1522318 RepID=UPI000783C2C2|nr:SIMPL domain-containing protein [Bacillus kwashiorkori]